jgi:hypothetical protein
MTSQRSALLRLLRDWPGYVRIHNIAPPDRWADLDDDERAAINVITRRMAAGRRAAALKLVPRPKLAIVRRLRDTMRVFLLSVMSGAQWMG